MKCNGCQKNLFPKSLKIHCVGCSRVYCKKRCLKTLEFNKILIEDWYCQSCQLQDIDCELNGRNQMEPEDELYGNSYKTPLTSLKKNKKPLHPQRTYSNNNQKERQSINLDHSINYYNKPTMIVGIMENLPSDEEETISNSVISNPDPYFSHEEDRYPTKLVCENTDPVTNNNHSRKKIRMLTSNDKVIRDEYDFDYDQSKTKPTTSPYQNSRKNDKKRARIDQKRSLAEQTRNSQNQSPIPLHNYPSNSGKACGGNSSFMSSESISSNSRIASESQSSLWEAPATSTSMPTVNNNTCGDVGLCNLGNTCYMNSGLQCLMHTGPLVEYFLKKNVPDHCLSNEFQKLINKAWKGTHSVLSPIQFRNVLGRIHPSFTNNRQHDCQELLALILDIMNEQLKSWKNKKELHNSVESDMKINLTIEGAADDSDDHHPQDAKKRKLSITNNNNESGGSGDNKENQGNDDVVPMEVDELAEPEEISSDEDSSKNVQSLAKRREKAENVWNNYLANNNTVITKTFQGMFKSNVICSVCGYISDTYEPFMYLSVPIPKLKDRKLNITFISLNSMDKTPLETEFSIQSSDTIERFLERFSEYLKNQFVNIDPKNMVVAEVHNYYATIIENEKLVRSLTDKACIYVYELNTNFNNLETCQTNSFGYYSQPYHSQMNPTTYLNTEENWDIDNSAVPEQILANEDKALALAINESSSANSNNSTIHIEKTPLLSCTICLENFKDSELKQHSDCECKLCNGCLQESAKHYKSSSNNKENDPSINQISSADKENLINLKCAVCSEIVETSSFFPVLYKTKDVTLLKVTALFRNEDMDQNKSTVFGHPLVIKIPSTISRQDLYEFVNILNPFPGQNFKLLYVIRDGKKCSKCLYTDNCLGCEIPINEELITFSSYETISFSFSNLPQESIDHVNPSNMILLPNHFYLSPPDEPVIDIRDCIKEFAQIESLDEQNPWYCPKCKKNQCATKSLTICRFPDYLIVYLKRFIYFEQSSNKLNNKLKFPMEDLDVSDIVAEEFQGFKDLTYDLYSIVCHYGTASSGHYTSFGKNPLTHEWHNFNDTTVEQKSPSDPEYASAYILFYSRKGAKFDITTPLTESISKEIDDIVSSTSNQVPHNGPISNLYEFTDEKNNNTVLLDSQTTQSHSLIDDHTSYTPDNENDITEKENDEALNNQENEVHQQPHSSTFESNGSMSLNKISTMKNTELSADSSSSSLSFQ